ncbi:MAG: hypothetical protein ACRDF0_01560, partial [Candidatus Limnocylindria bacterium]
RLAAARVFAATNAGQPASLVITDAVVTEAVARAAGAPGAPPFRDPAVAIAPDGIRVSGTATAAFLRFPIRATLVPEVAGGRFRLTLRELDTGGLPAFLRPRVNDLIAQAADPAAWQLPLRVEAVVLRAGCAVVRGAAEAS